MYCRGQMRPGNLPLCKKQALYKLMIKLNMTNALVFLIQKTYKVYPLLKGCQVDASKPSSCPGTSFFSHYFLSWYF